MEEVNRKQLICSVSLPLYIRQYYKSKKVRPKYYEKDKTKIPKRLQQEIGSTLSWNTFNTIKDKKKSTKSFLVDTASGERVIANPATVGRANLANINGQDIYNGSVSSHGRGNMMNQIKLNLKQAVKLMPVFTSFPIRVDVYLFDTVIDVFSNGQDWDIDNRFFPYGKALADTMKAEGKIPDDNCFYITEPPHAIFCPVDDKEDRKLIIQVFKDNRPIILNNYYYQKKHGTSLTPHS